MIAEDNPIPKAIACMTDPDESTDGGITVTILCENCSHDHQSQNLCLEHGTCNCINGTGKDLGLIPLDAWVGGLEKNYELTSLKGRKDDHKKIKSLCMNTQTIVSSSLHKRAKTWSANIFYFLFVFGFFLAGLYYLTISIMYWNFSAGNVGLFAFSLLIVACLLIKLHELFSDLTVDYRNYRSRSKYKIMKGTGSTHL